MHLSYNHLYGKIFLICISANVPPTEAKDFFAQLSPFWDRLFHIALNLVHSSEDAEDMVQESILKAFARREQFRGESNLYTWLVRITINTCYDHLRKEQRMQKRTKSITSPEDGEADLEIVDKRANPEELFQLSEDSVRLREALAKLNPDQKQLLVLRYFENLSFVEISRMLGLAEGTIKSRVNKARDILRQHLQGKE